MKTDTILQQDVIDELAWEPSIDAAAIGVAVEEGIVTLSGHAPSYVEKWAAEHVVKRVAGVRGVENEIAVRLPGASVRTDSDIARAALQSLEWDVWVPQQRVTLVVGDGWIKLEGTVDNQHQKLAAARAVRGLIGVKGLTNLIAVQPIVQPGEIASKITAALQRSAVLDARGIQVDTLGRKVALRGTVHAWEERAAAERAAWSAPGVAEVDNQLVVLSGMTCKDKLKTYLHDRQVPFVIQQHHIAYTAQDVAASEHLPGQLVTKVVMAIADGDLIMLVLPADHRADLAKVRAAVGARELWLANEREFADRFPDCEIGAMPPFVNLYGLPVYDDRSLTFDQAIVFQAGTHNETMRIKYADFARLVKPKIVDISRSPHATMAQYY
jgi:osmotically-inducible protein OsmY/prolyl-tRNA editing enzyme YbaK/EbsC (Cys-tRNA(Pro) deacylase)